MYIKKLWAISYKKTHNHRWCEGTLGVKKSTEETVGIALN